MSKSTTWKSFHVTTPLRILKTSRTYVCLGVYLSIFTVLEIKTEKINMYITSLNKLVYYNFMKNYIFRIKNFSEKWLCFTLC